MVSVQKQIFASLRGHFKNLLVDKDNKVKSMIKFIIPKIMFNANIDDLDITELLNVIFPSLEELSFPL